MASSGASDYMCSPSGHTPSAEAISQLESLFAAAGKTLPKETGPSEHCEKCLMPSLAALPFNAALCTTRKLAIAIDFTPLPAGFHYSAQGPPVGGRAPPLFV